MERAGQRPLAVAIYAIVALILVWPLINRLVVRRLWSRGRDVPPGGAHPLVELAEELAAGGEELGRQESVLARAEGPAEGTPRVRPAESPPPGERRPGDGPSRPRS